MDLRDGIDVQLAEHIKTLRVVAKQETPAPLIWEEMQRYFDEAAAQLERNVLPKIEVKAPHLDLRGGAPKVAEYFPVPATSIEAADEDAAAESPGFLASSRGRNGTG